MKKWHEDAEVIANILAIASWLGAASFEVLVPSHFRVSFWLVVVATILTIKSHRLAQRKLLPSREFIVNTSGEVRQAVERKLRRHRIAGLIRWLVPGISLLILLLTYWQPVWFDGSGGPTLTPTPLEGQPAMDDEFLIVVASFECLECGYSQLQTDILESLEQLADEVSEVSLLKIGHTIRNQDEAVSIGNTYNASVVIYGRVTTGGVTVRYAFTRTDFLFIYSENDKDRYVIVPFGNGYKLLPGDIVVTLSRQQLSRVSSDQIRNFEAFLYEGADVRYFAALMAGEAYYYLGNYEQALTLLSLATESFNETRADQLGVYKAFYLRAQTNFNLGNYDQAFTDYSTVIRSSPGFAGAYRERGLINLYVFEDYESALADFNTAIDIQDHPSEGGFLDLFYANMYFYRGRAHTKLDNYDSAIADYSSAIKLFPRFADAYMTRAELYLFQGRHDEAIEDCNRVIEIDEMSFAAFHLRGLANAFRGNKSMAISDFDRALELSPNQTAILYNRAGVHDRLGNKQQALDDYSRVIELDPTSPIAFFALWDRGNIYDTEQNYQAAIADYTNLLEQTSATSRRGDLVNNPLLVHFFLTLDHMLLENYAWVVANHCNPQQVDHGSFMAYESFEFVLLCAISHNKLGDNEAFEGIVSSLKYMPDSAGEFGVDVQYIEDEPVVVFDPDTVLGALQERRLQIIETKADPW